MTTNLPPVGVLPPQTPLFATPPAAVPIDSPTEASTAPTPLPLPLTPRLRQVLDSVMQGCGNREIAEQLGISDNTLKVEMYKLINRLGGEFVEAGGRGFLVSECRRRQWLHWAPPWQPPIPGADPLSLCLDYVLKNITALSDFDLRRSAQHHLHAIESRTSERIAATASLVPL